jgi:hypothetical protein
MRLIRKIQQVSAMILALFFAGMLSSCFDENTQSPQNQQISTEEYQALKSGAMELCQELASDDTQCEAAAEAYAECKEEDSGCVDVLKEQVQAILIEIYGEEEGARIYEENLSILEERISVVEETADVASCAVELSAQESEGVVSLSWTANECADFVGYKVVWSADNESPKYPEDGYLKWITDSETLSYEDQAQAQTNYYRITSIIGDKKVHSNVLQIEVDSQYVEIKEEKEPEQVSCSEEERSIEVSAANLYGEVKVSWSAYECDDFAGYKVVWSDTNETPSYPEDSYLAYITDPSVLEFKDSARAETNYYSVTVLTTGESVIGNAVEVNVAPEDVVVQKEEETEEKLDLKEESVEIVEESKEVIEELTECLCRLRRVTFRKNTSPPMKRPVLLKSRSFYSASLFRSVFFEPVF